MPIDYSKYPANWKTEIRPRILERAGHKCERCGVANYAIIMRSEDNKDDYLVYDVDDDCHYTPDRFAIRLSELPEEYTDSKYIKIVLTIAHIHDHNPMACDDDNLQALCQRCHLLLDAPLHAKRARETNYQKRQAQIAATGQLSLFDVEQG